MDSDKFARHTALAGFGPHAQDLLAKATVAIVGVGGLGCPAAQYLASNGVGKLILVDDGTVEESNLHRQILFTSHSVGSKKVDVAKERLETTVEAVPELLTKNNSYILSAADVILDCTDNSVSRDTINTACLKLDKPLVFGAAIGMQGHVSVFTDKTGCYRCVHRTIPASQSCEEAGVLGTVPGTVGLLQATEAIKLITGTGTPLKGTLLTYNALSSTFSHFKFQKNEQCVACGEGKEMESTISVDEVKKWMNEKKDFQFIDIREQEERDENKIEGTDFIPMNTIPDNLDKISKDKPVVVHCRTDNRSRHMQKFLKDQGFANIVVLQGGIVAWEKFHVH